MIEIVFSDSACGSLKVAQTYGKGEYVGGCIGVMLSKHDGSAPTHEEIEVAQKQAEEDQRLEWERAVPMGGKAIDVFGFNLMLSVGDISDIDFIGKRISAIESLWSIYPDHPSDEPFDLADNIRQGIKMVCKRITPGDEIRIWYSNQPDELCGLYWFMSELAKLPAQPKAVYIVKLPQYEYKENGTMVTHSSWGEISPSDWHNYTVYAEKTTDVFCEYCVSTWRSLQQENAPLRAVLNGKLQSVAENIYDSFICREITQQQDEFSEAVLIETILGKYQLGIGDAWIANRIEPMIINGSLEIASEHTQGMPLYHRKLRKVT